MRKIIFAAYDLGGADALTPVIKRLTAKRAYKILNLFGGPAAKFAREQRLKYQDAAKCSGARLKKILSVFKPNLVCTGTSSGATVEKRLWKIARERSIPTIAILDSWINYKLQFHPYDLPDRILVMDDLAKKEMVAEGFLQEKIIITGNPHFETFRLFPPPPRLSRTIAFIDQHFSELLKKGIHERMGYDEREVFRDLVRALTGLRWKGAIALKFHPGSKDRTRYDVAIARSSISVVKIPDGVPLRRVLERSQLVVGMTSMALFEAALSGKKVLSYQPGLKRADPLIANRLGLTIPVYKKRDLLPALRNLLGRKSLPKTRQDVINKYTKGRATNKVITVIESLCIK